ncbi:hypothetical protein EI42_04246 [Thermosporothrix hazakensis]|jgi:hypothetical protein|uniref:Uncharacterized protein n=2 Tax=Thermosporothrix TaxID=768650 RepID=A0A326U5V4_THEHA|nr:hypothetical protein [Thermosporothrix hazakensis]PZW25402.1 hypothetical protein EI42_04246 [Thermosporothrix hazakensis]BBH90736.1 hypothetical protein KTC_54870 [Thermosporothrix sp. COM3]GCE48786.1 hypothetical protein KTH_36550 [Thermosporothrix hazakensis]
MPLENDSRKRMQEDSLLFRLLPSRYTLKITPFSEGNPYYQRRIRNKQTGEERIIYQGEKLADLIQHSENEVIRREWHGAVFRFSLQPWLHADPEKTYLSIVPSVSLLYPLQKVDPAVRGHISEALRERIERAERRTVREPAPSEEEVMNEYETVGRTRGTGTNGHGHHVWFEVHSAGKPASEWLTQPEIIANEIACPYCDISLSNIVPFTKLVLQLCEEWEDEDVKLLVRVVHPASHPETHTPPPECPFLAEKEWTIEAEETPPVIAHDELDRPLVLPSHDHLLFLRSGEGDIAANQLAPQLQGLHCPLCGEALAFGQEVTEALQSLMDEAKNEAVPVSVTLSHPVERASTALPHAKFPFAVQTHSLQEELRRQPGFYIQLKAVSEKH